MVANRTSWEKQKAAWLASPVVPELAKQAIVKMDEKALKNAFEGKLTFGTSGIRALMGPGDARLNIITVRRITVGLVNYLQKQNQKLEKLQLLVGCDNRRNSMRFLQTVVTVLTSYGIRVWTYSKDALFPVPVLSYVIRELHLDGGIMLTASHNPKEYNGYKVYGATGAQLLNDETSKLASEIAKTPTPLSSTFTHNKKFHKTVSSVVIKDYLTKVSTLAYNKRIDNKTNLKFVYTPLSGTGHWIVPELLKMNGYKPFVVPEQSEPDPTFQHVTTPNPENFGAFDKAVSYAAKNDAQLLLASDPDADRLGVVIKHNGEWRHFNGNEMGVLFLHYLTTTQQLPPNSYLVRTYVSTDLVDRMAARYDLKVAVCPTGFKWIGHMMNITSGHFVLGFEEAVGATLLPLGRDKSSLESALLTCEMAAYYQEQNRTLVDVLEQEIFGEYGFLYSATIARTFSLKTDWQAITQRLFRFFQTYQPKTLGDLRIKQKTYVEEGEIILWHFGDGSWCAFRISGTEPKLKYYIHATGDNLASAQAHFRIIRKHLDKLVDNQLQV